MRSAVKLPAAVARVEGHGLEWAHCHMPATGWEAVNRIQAAIRDIRSGLSDVEIVLKHGVERATVERWRVLLATPGYPIKRRKRKPPSERDAEIVSELKGGASYVAVALRYGVTRQRIEQIARRCGLPQRRRTKRRLAPQFWDDEDWLRVEAMATSLTKETGIHVTAADVVRMLVREGLDRHDAASQEAHLTSEGNSPGT